MAWGRTLRPHSSLRIYTPLMFAREMKDIFFSGIDIRKLYIGLCWWRLLLHFLDAQTQNHHTELYEIAALLGQ